MPVLGEILRHESRDSAAVADAFCGSGAVAWHLSENIGVPVIAGDLQQYAVDLAAAVIERNHPVDTWRHFDRWIYRAAEKAREIFDFFPNAARSIAPDCESYEDIRKLVFRCRQFCDESLPAVLSRVGGKWPMTRAYGGHYFSPEQAIMLDSLRQTVDVAGPHSKVALAALIEAASSCAASPGHTAQPFQPTEGAARYIKEIWTRDVVRFAGKSFGEVGRRYSQVRGKAAVANFVDTVKGLSEGDLVFADPPYSDVHYSRFYHVLETLAKGDEIVVSGVGRYPPAESRPRSGFSMKGDAQRSAIALFKASSAKRAKLVVTFPINKARNGLSAKDFISLGRSWFSNSSYEEVASDFSTLGGNARNRASRSRCVEAIITFRP